MNTTGVTQSSTSHPYRNLPDDIWSEILSTLPVQPLLRFRSVSKSWLRLISDPNFALLHLTRFNYDPLNEPQLFVTRSAAWDDEWVYRCSKTFTLTTKLGSLLSTNMSSTDTFRNIPSLSYIRSWEVVCFIDGLFMLKDAYSFEPTPDLMLWNPSIRKARFLPPSPEIPDKMTSVDFGLGFDLNKDYKHDRFAWNKRNSLHSISIYSVGTNSWKLIQFQGNVVSDWMWTFSLHPLKTCCSNGVLYLIGRLSLSESELVSFDLSSEVFDSTDLPADDDFKRGENSSEAITHVDDGDSLAVVYLWETKGSLWVMGSFGSRDKDEAKSWRKRYTFSLVMPGLYTGKSCSFLCLKNGEMFLDWRRAVTSYNVETRDKKIVAEKKDYEDMFKVYGYMESLLLL